MLEIRHIAARASSQTPLRRDHIPNPYSQLARAKKLVNVYKKRRKSTQCIRYTALL